MFIGTTLLQRPACGPPSAQVRYCVKRLFHVFLNECLTEAILAVRTYAFLGKQLWLGILLSTLIAGETAFLLYVSIAGVYQIPPIPLGDMKSPCTASDKPGEHVVSGFWLAPVAFDLVCTFLTMWKVCPQSDRL